MAGAGFELDAFQVQALDALDAGQSVVVAAPTGAGKTVVGEYAVARALEEGAKAFYTTPLKALSNQKYGELARLHGTERVGLLTGDNAINPHAPVVVMTTEVLRNMIYASSPGLEGLRYVVLDEVHYLQNAYRGPVWEEVIIHLPPEVDLVCLSATVSNAEELASWIRTVRGGTTAVIEEHRPVPLHDLYLLGDRSTDRLLLLPTLVDGRPNAEVTALEAKSARGLASRGPRHGRLFTPRRSETIGRLEDDRLLPAIYFIFSRAGCDEAAAQCVRDGLRLTSHEERRHIRALAEAHTAGIDPADLALLGYERWLSGLEAGFAAHHAGLVPPFKEAVEACFSAGLVKVVFATETLSLGINMPARSVVIENLSKFTGERHELLTPGEYTQLTGRAGRRGLDPVGYAVVLWSPWSTFEQVAGLAGARSYALTSSFRPTYNMAANLVRRYPPDVAHHLLNLSFAQFQADREVVRLEAQLERAQASLAQAEADATCELGDTEEYRRLVLAGQQRGARPPRDEAEVSAALESLRPGDVLVVPGGKSGGRVAVVSTARRRGGDVRLRAITPERRLVSLMPRDFPSPPSPVARVELPVPFAPNSSGFQRQVASALIAARLDGGVLGGSRAERRSWAGPGAEALAVAAHPVAGCPDARAHLRALTRAERHRREVERLRRRARGRTDSLARQFDRVLRVLEARHYLDGWSLTPAGERLARLYHESDLLIAECVEPGLLDGLGPGELAALASVFTYESRRAGERAAWLPTPRLRERWPAIERTAAALNRDEEAAGLPLTRPPDAGFAAAAHAWASGRDLAGALGQQEISGGDFVRNVKQLIDLTRQLGDLAPEEATAATTRAAAERLFRGVVAASSAVAP